jgi:hypothetical protein
MTGRLTPFGYIPMNVALRCNRMNVVKLCNVTSARHNIVFAIPAVTSEWLSLRCGTN